jgi:hypothetical protein
MKFKKIGAPQITEIIDSNLRDIQQSLSKIDESVKLLFGASSKTLIDQYGAEEAVSRLLAMVSGHTEKIKSRSILCGAEGYVTYLIKTTKEFTHLGYIWGIIKKLCSEKIHGAIRGMKQFKNKLGAVCDIFEDHSKEFEEILFNDKFYGHNYTIEKLDKSNNLPELIEPDYSGRGGYGGSTATPGPMNGNGHVTRSHSTGGNGQANGGKFQVYDRKPRGDKKFDIFIGNLPFQVDEAEIKNHFISHKISGGFDVRLPMDGETGKPKGFGFVSAHDQSAFDEILKLDGKKLKDRSLRINSANK